MRLRERVCEHVSEQGCERVCEHWVCLSVCVGMGVCFRCVSMGICEHVCGCGWVKVGVCEHVCGCGWVKVGVRILPQIFIRAFVYLSSF